MSLKKVTNLETNKVEMEFDASKETFDAAVDRAFKKNASKVNVPGFRKGKAPRAIIEKMYGKGVFYEDALNDIIPDAYSAALKEADLEPVSRPEFDVDAIDEEGVKFKAVFYVKPVAEVKEYKGLPADRTVRPVTDSDIEGELNRVRERNARTLDVTDRPAQNGDTVVIDYEGSVDGVPFEGGKAEKYSLKLGSGTFIPGYEEQVIGHSIGESFDVNVTFPTPYSSEELAGKAAVFKVTLHEIKATELPALDDEFAKDVSEFDTLDEYKASIKAKMEESNAKSADMAVEEQLINVLLENTTVEIPAPMIASEVENVIRDRDYSMRSQGLSLDMFLKYTGQTLDDMRKQAEPVAERQVKTRLALEKIAEIESLKVEEADLEAEYTKLSEAYNMSVEDIKKQLSADLLENDIRLNKAVKLIRESAVITEKAYEEPKAENTEKPAKAKTSKAKTETKAKGESKPKTASKAKAAKSEEAPVSQAEETEKPKKTRTTKAKAAEGEADAEKPKKTAKKTEKAE